MLLGFSLYQSPHPTHFPRPLGLTERRPSLLTVLGAGVTETPRSDLREESCPGGHP